MRPEAQHRGERRRKNSPCRDELNIRISEVGGICFVCAQNPRLADVLPTLNGLEEVFGVMENSTSPCSKTGLGQKSKSTKGEDW
jgi:hypothetical protein